MSAAKRTLEFQASSSEEESSSEEYESGEEEYGGESEENDLDEGQETDDDVSENEEGKKECKSYDSKSEGLMEIKRNDGVSQKNRFQRIWSLEDEMILLNSMNEFGNEGKEVDSSTSTMELFCEFLKGKLSFTEKPNRRQVSKKIKVLKRKYYYTATSFTGDHDLRMKEIASQVWVNSSKRKCLLLEEEVQKFQNLFGSKKKLKFQAKDETLEEKLRNQKNDKKKQSLKRMDLRMKGFKLIFDGIWN